jgi:hypothetical protein
MSSSAKISATSASTTDTVSGSSESSDNVFQYGDRVKIVGLESKNSSITTSSLTATSSSPSTNPASGAANRNLRTELNGQHGFIAYEGGKLILPNGRYSIHLDRLQPVGIQILPKNIEKVNILAPSNPQEKTRATVVDGTLQENGMLLLNIFNLLKWFIANKYFNDEEANQLHNIPKVPIEKRIKFNHYMIENWFTKTNTSAGVYLDFFQFVYSQTNMFHPQQRTFMIHSLNDILGMKSWYTSFQQDLWFVGKDYYGIYVVPDCNRLTVYRIVALHKPSTILPIESCPDDKPVLNKIPRKFKNVTVLPWQGRFIYDMTTMSTDLSETEAATTDLAILLQSVVLKAIQEQRVIDHFSELYERSNMQQQQQQKQQKQQQTPGIPEQPQQSSQESGNSQNTIPFRSSLN